MLIVVIWRHLARRVRARVELAKQLGFLLLIARIVVCCWQTTGDGWTAVCDAGL